MAYKWLQHKALAAALEMMDGPRLGALGCRLVGATPLALTLGEHRVAKRLRLYATSREGYGELRAAVWTDGPRRLFREAPQVLRPPRTHMHGVHFEILADLLPVPVEIHLAPGFDGPAGEDLHGVPQLPRADLFAERLLTNADRHRDPEFAGRDAFDLAVMRQAWGEIPLGAWARAESLYGPTARWAWEAAERNLATPGWLEARLPALAGDMAWIPRLRGAAEIAPAPGL